MNIYIVTKGNVYESMELVQAFYKEEDANNLAESIEVEYDDELGKEYKHRNQYAAYVEELTLR